MYYEYNEKTLQTLHKVHTEMIKDFHEICERHNISYFAVGGTLLGAIRHKGFIPWDDNVDFGMLRKDYDRLLQVASEEYSDKYYLYTPEHRNTPYDVTPRFARKNSLFVTPFAANAGVTDMGIFLDIFVYEDIDPCKIKRQFRQVVLTKMLYTEVTSRRRFAVGKGFLRIIKLISKYCFFFLAKILRLTPEKTIALYLKQTIGTKDTGFVSHFWGTEPEITKKDEIFPVLEVPFENITICIPHDWDRILKQSYGDYMELPPKEDRVNHAAVMLRFPPQYDCGDSEAD